MELNLKAQEKLRELLGLSAQLMEAENRWANLYVNRKKAEEERVEAEIWNMYSDQLDVEAGRIASIKYTIVEHVHVLAALIDAQLWSDGAQD